MLDGELFEVLPGNESDLDWLYRFGFYLHDDLGQSTPPSIYRSFGAALLGAEENQNVWSDRGLYLFTSAGDKLVTPTLAEHPSATKTVHLAQDDIGDDASFSWECGDICAYTKSSAHHFGMWHSETVNQLQQLAENRHRPYSHRRNIHSQ